LFTPFGFPPAGGAPAAEEPKAAAAPEGDNALDDLKQQLAAMQAQIEKLASKS
jgi:polyhydroxyalkanoate synthesis regulator protein